MGSMECDGPFPRRRTFRFSTRLPGYLDDTRLKLFDFGRGGVAGRIRRRQIRTTPSSMTLLAATMHIVDTYLQHFQWRTIGTSTRR